MFSTCADYPTKFNTFADYPTMFNTCADYPTKFNTFAIFAVSAGRPTGGPGAAAGLQKSWAKC